MKHEDALSSVRLANPVESVDPDEMAALRAILDDEISASVDRRQRPRLRWQPSPSLAATVALIVTLALFLPLRFVGQGDGRVDSTATDPPLSMTARSTVPPSSSATTSTIASTAIVPLVLPLGVDPTELLWRRIEMPGLSGGYQWFDSIVAGGPGLIAVGSPNENSTEFIWTSEDGVEWIPASIEMAGDYGWAFDITVGGPGYVAVGSSIWTSPDGISWSEAALDDPIVGELRAVTVGGPGLVAVGRFNLGLASIYTSTDGMRWSLIAQEGAPEPDLDSEITDIVAGGPGLVAVGHYGSIGAVWTSPDGFEWSRVPRNSAVFGTGREGTELLSVAADDSGFVAVGRITDDDVMGVWRSSDGRNWSVVPLDPAVLNESHELTTIVSTEQGFVAGGAGEDIDAGAWFSPDGVTWTRLEAGDALGGPGYQVVSDITVFGDRLVAVGRETIDMDDSEVVWIAEPAQG